MPALGLVLSLCACEKEPLPPAREADLSREPGPTHAVRTEHDPVLRVLARSGAMKDAAEDTALAEGTLLRRDRMVQLARGERLELGLDAYGTVRVHGPARLLLLPEGAPALLVREGVVSIDCATPPGRRATSALWLATPHVRLDVAESARFVVRVSEHATAFSLLSGQVTPTPGSPLAAGEARCFSALGHDKLTLRGRASLESTERRLATQAPCERAIRRTQGVRVEAALELALDSVQSGVERERKLLAEHGRTRDADAGAALQAEIAHASADLLRVREEGRALRARYEAAHLGEPLPKQASAPVERPALGGERKRPLPPLPVRARTLLPYRE